MTMKKKEELFGENLKFLKNLIIFCEERKIKKTFCFRLFIFSISTCNLLCTI